MDDLEKQIKEIVENPPFIMCTCICHGNEGTGFGHPLDKTECEHCKEAPKESSGTANGS